MIVCIAEKPSVARDIANVLGATRQHQGYIEGNGYQVTWAYGHLCELKEPQEYNERWKRWDLYDLPMIPQKYKIRLKNDEGAKKQFAIIENLIKNADGIINCGDAGQEGELIQRWIMQKAMAKCPVKRLWISSLTEDAIREGFNNLKDQSEYDALYLAGMSRAVGDWLLGMNCTRLYSKKYVVGNGTLSVGRVQTPTLALIVRRQQEIDNFVPEQYWILSTNYRDTTFNATKGKFTSQEEGLAIIERIKNLPFSITSVTSKKGVEAPPRLYDLTSLQVECNKKFGYSAEMTLNLIQGLYEKKLTTYPRVDTTFLSDDIYAKCPGILNNLTMYADLLQPLRGKKLKKSKKVFDSSKVTDHHAIIPTGVQPQHLSDMEKRVYDLVARRFISVFYPDCRFLSTTVLGKVDNEEFKATGKQIEDPGWRAVYTRDKKADKEEDDSQTENKSEEEKVLPTFTVGESGPHVPSLAEKWTQPPKPYTEATLLRAMETAGKLVDDEELRDLMKENGIGRPSTRAAIIQTLFKRHYIRKERKNLFPTETGKGLIGIIKEELLKSAELTGRWEKKLRDIEHKKYDATTFVRELEAMVTEIVEKVRRDNSGTMIKVDNNAGNVKTEEKKTTRKRTKKAPQDTAETSTATKGQAKTDVQAPAGNTDPTRMVAGFRPKGKSADAGTVAAASAQQGTASNEDEWVGLPCPVCHVGHIIKGRTAYGCSRWREGCTYRMPFDKNNGGH